MRPARPWILALTLAVACAAPPAPEVRYVPMAGPMELPFSAAVRVGSMLYLSGQLGTDGAGKLVPGGIAAETRQALENVKALLEANGSSLDRVVKCTAMLADIREWADMNQVYVTYFPATVRPAAPSGPAGSRWAAGSSWSAWRPYRDGPLAWRCRFCAPPNDDLLSRIIRETRLAAVEAWRHVSRRQR